RLARQEPEVGMERAPPALEQRPTRVAARDALRLLVDVAEGALVALGVGLEHQRRAERRHLAQLEAHPRETVASEAERCEQLLELPAAWLGQQVQWQPHLFVRVAVQQFGQQARERPRLTPVPDAREG